MTRLSSVTATDVLRVLDGVRGGHGQWTAKCPAHDDGHASLSITEKRGMVLWKCQAGCDQKDVTAAIAGKLGIATNGASNGTGASDKKLVATYTYRNADGTVAMFRDRFEWLERGETKKDIYPRQLDGTKKGTPQVPYNLPAVVEAIAAKATIVFVEGEKAADAITAHGYSAVTTTGSATSWKPRFAEFFRGARVLFWPDADAAGERYIETVARDLQSVVAELRVLRFAGKPAGWDAADFFADGGTGQELKKAITAAAPYAPVTGNADAVSSSLTDPDAGVREAFPIVRILEGAPPAPPALQVSDLLLDQDINLWTGHGGSAKSTIMLHTAVCVALGLPVFRTLTVHRSGPVLLVVPEDGEVAVRMMLDAIIAGLELDTAQRALLEDRIVMIADEAIVDVTRHASRLGRTARGVGAVLVALDPLRNLLGGASEQENDVAGPACDALRREICRNVGASVLMNHHLRKPLRELADAAATVHDIRGGGGWANGARLVFTVTKNADRVQLAAVKANRMRHGISHDLRLGIEAEETNKAHWLSCTVTDANFGASSSTLTVGVGRPINPNERTMLEALYDEGELDRRVSRSEWVKTSGLKEDTWKSIKKRLQAAELIDAREIGINRNGKAKTYNYALTSRGISALKTGWTDSLSANEVAECKTA
jgi:hypothetical protein